MTANIESAGRTSGEMGPSGEVMRLPVILGSLLGITTLLLAANIAALVICVTANVRLKHKLKQFERSHSRYNVVISMLLLRFATACINLTVGIDDHSIISHMHRSLFLLFQSPPKITVIGGTYQAEFMFPLAIWLS